MAYQFKIYCLVEWNYNINDYDLKGIIQALDEWTQQYTRALYLLQVYINNENLEYFITTKPINWWPACWSETLSRFEFKVDSHPWKECGKADTVARTSATMLVSVWNTRVFRMALTALTEPRTIWQRITRFPSHRRRVVLHTYLHYFAPGIRTIRTTRVLHSSQGLQLCCRQLHNAWWCLCHSSADSHIVPLRYIGCRTRPIYV